MTYQIYFPEGSTVEHIKKTESNGTIWTFKSDADIHLAEKYREWLAEGNTPLPADPE